MPDDKDGHVSGESASLQDKRSLDQDLARQMFGRAIRSVRRFRCAVGDHELDEEVDADESRQDPSWVERRKPGDVV